MKRSEVMARVGSKDTGPELAVRSHLWKSGLRYSLHRNNLPGRPDMHLAKHKAVVFVHGCFWHQHPGCPRATTPKRNRAFWKDKFEANRRRDRRAADALRRDGYSVVTVWECEADRPERLSHRLSRNLPGDLDS